MKAIEQIDLARGLKYITSGEGLRLKNDIDKGRHEGVVIFELHRCIREKNLLNYQAFITRIGGEQ